jgi:hypothetical protein
MQVLQIKKLHKIYEAFLPSQINKLQIRHKSSQAYKKNFFEGNLHLLHDNQQISEN